MNSRRRLADALRHHAQTHGDALAMSDATVKLTWAQLHERVMHLAQGRLPAGGAIGLYGDNGCAWAIAFLAAQVAGRFVVPLPTFFTDAQLAHIVEAVQLTSVITTRSHADSPAIRGATMLPFAGIVDRRPAPWRHAAADGGLVVFTSGSTGTPKGVRLPLHNVIATADALIAAVEITSRDAYFSAMPFAMLLELVAAIVIPVLVGAPTAFDAECVARIVSGRPVSLADAIDRARPSVMVLVPQLLSALVGEVEARALRLDSLRFVAVGGASTSASVMAAARRAVLPVYEGYGLTECTSVVALNTPGHQRAGTVGRPLAGTSVEIVDGEIVVSGPSVMAGYLHGPDLPDKRWPTGDIGALTEDGYLVVRGRKDNLIVRSSGRNVSPEWIEAALTAWPGVMGAIVVATPEGDDLVACVVARWPEAERASQIDGLSPHLAGLVPAYARPGRIVVVTPDEAATLGLFRHGKPDRKSARLHLLQHAHS